MLAYECVKQKRFYGIRLLVVVFVVSTIDGESSNVGLSSLFGDWAVQVDGWALVALVTHELSVQLLVSLQGNSSLLVVFVADEVVVGLIDLLDVINSDSGDAVVTVLLYADQAVVVDVHHLVVGIDESLHGLGEIGIGLAQAGRSDGLLELFGGDLAVLIEIGKGGDLVPQSLHDGAVLIQASWVDGALALDDGGTQSHALEVIVVQEAVVVNIVHVTNDEFDALIPRVAHFDFGI